MGWNAGAQRLPPKRRLRVTGWPRDRMLRCNGEELRRLLIYPETPKPFFYEYTGTHIKKQTSVIVEP